MQHTGLTPTLTLRNPSSDLSSTDASPTLVISPLRATARVETQDCIRTAVTQGKDFHVLLRTWANGGALVECARQGSMALTLEYEARRSLKVPVQWLASPHTQRPITPRRSHLPPHSRPQPGELHETPRTCALCLRRRPPHRPETASSTRLLRQCAAKPSSQSP